MRRGRRGLLAFLAGFYLISVIVVVGFAVGEGIYSDILRTFLGEYVRARYVVLLLEYAVAIQTTAVLLYGSLLLSRSSGPPPLFFVVSIAVAALYAMLIATVQPSATARYQEISQRSSVALEEREKVRIALGLSGRSDSARSLSFEDLQQAQLEEARLHLTRYLAIDREDESAIRSLQGVETEIKRRQPAADVAAPDDAPDPALALSVGQLIDRASRYLANGDPFTAHYFATRAASIAPQSSPARDVMSRAERDMLELGLSDQEEAAQRFFRIKESARASMEEGRPEEAYYILKNLSLERPLDTELRAFISEARALLSERAFFTDEVPQESTLTRETRNVAVALDSVGSTRRVIYASSVIHANPTSTMVEEVEDAGEAPPVDVYFRDLEMIEFSRAGTNTHVRAPHAKLHTRYVSGESGGELAEGWHGTIILNALDRSDPDVAPKAAYRIRPDKPGPISFGLDPGVLRLMSLDNPDLQARSLPEVWALRSVAPDGMVVDIDVELSMRALMPFLILIISLAALPFGVRFAPRKRLGIVSILSLPLLLFAVHVAIQILLIVVRIITSYLAVTQGIVTAVIALGIGVVVSGVYAVSRVQATRNLTESRFD